MSPKPPTSVGLLQSRMHAVAQAQGTSPARIQVVIGTTTLAQMMPACAVKGGTAMKFRFGGATRFTRDLDVARAADAATFRQELQDSLRAGWGDFTGTLAEARAKPAPAGIPLAYVMKPFDVKLAYRGRSFMTVPLEVGHDEIGDTADTELALAPDIQSLFETLGLLIPEPVPVLATHHQVVQKLHACTVVGSERAHDLVDLQILIENDKQRPLDLPVTRCAAARLFNSRRAHAWPPAITPRPEWEPLYQEAAQGMPVRPNLDDACAWGNALIQRIDAAPKES